MWSTEASNMAMEGVYVSQAEEEERYESYYATISAQSSPCKGGGS